MCVCVCACVSVCLSVFTNPSTRTECEKDEFLSGVWQVLIKNFPSRRPVTIPTLKIPIFSTISSWIHFAKRFRVLAICKLTRPGFEYGSQCPFPTKTYIYKWQCWFSQSHFVGLWLTSLFYLVTLSQLSLHVVTHIQKTTPNLPRSAYIFINIHTKYQSYDHTEYYVSIIHTHTHTHTHIHTHAHTYTHAHTHIHTHTHLKNCTQS